ncbi:hypothetical protein dhabil_182 [Escherichia phage dhabil]|nr:hypothetical protein dhaeg_139 [Escherichia phage dhaeg]QHR72525.1 hypothetical protein dhabil_182 [Escherichia phage dhabil]
MKAIMSVLALSLVALAAVPFIVDVGDETQVESSIVVSKDGTSVKIGNNLHMNPNGTLGVQLGNTCVSTTGKVNTCF